MEPTAAEVRAHSLDTSVTEICTWVGFDQAEINTYCDLLGFEVIPAVHPQLLCMLSVDQHQTLLKDWYINGEKAKPILLMKAALVFKVARFVCGVKDEPPPTTLAITGP